MNQPTVLHFEKKNTILDLPAGEPNIDISIDNEEAFKLTCKYGHLKMAKWLIKIKPDIEIDIKRKVTTQCPPRQCGTYGIDGRESLCRMF